MNSFRTMLTLTTVAALAVGASGCTTTDRAGGKAADPVTTLTFAHPSETEPPPQVQAWADQVEQASDGSLSIEFEEGWRSGEVDYEKDTISDVKAGKVDLAWVGARSFDRVGVTDFQALLAPMMVDSHDLQAAVFEEGIPEEMMAGVADAGVTALAVLPGPMRKLLGVEKAFVALADFRGKVVGMQDSALTQQAMEALGAETLAMAGGAKLEGVDAYEQQLASIFTNGYVTRAGYVTGNLDLWPRPAVLIANPETVGALSDGQRSALLQSGIDSLPAALDIARAEDEDAVANLCRQGMVLTAASDAQLASLRGAWQPLYDDLAADPDTAGWLERIRTLKESVSAGPDTAVCPADEPSGDGDDPVAGDYVATIDWPNADVPEDCKPGPPEGQGTSVYELSLHDGSVELNVRVGGPDAPAEHGYTGSYRVFRDQIELEDGISLTAHVEVDNQRLVLSDMRGGCGHAAIWTTSPWVRVDQPAQSDELTGVWTTELTAADWSDAGWDGPAGTWTLEFADGWVTGTQPDGEIGYQARYSAFRGRLVTSESIDVLHASYRVAGDRLHLSDVTVPGTDDGGPYVVVWASHPWTRQAG